MIPEPTILYGMRSMKPYGVAGEAGPEWILNQHQVAGSTVTITGNNFTVREEADIHKIGKALVDQICLRQGIHR
jgi:hypothetical protein